MKAEIVSTYVFFENLYENRINAVVRYNKKSFAVSITTDHAFNEAGIPVIESINSFKYLEKVRHSDARNTAIKRAMKGMTYNY